MLARTVNQAMSRRHTHRGAHQTLSGEGSESEFDDERMSAGSEHGREGSESEGEGYVIPASLEEVLGEGSDLDGDDLLALALHIPDSADDNDDEGEGSEKHGMRGKKKVLFADVLDELLPPLTQHDEAFSDPARVPSRQHRRDRALSLLPPPPVPPQQSPLQTSPGRGEQQSRPARKHSSHRSHRSERVEREAQGAGASDMHGVEKANSRLSRAISVVDLALSRSASCM